MIWKRLASHLQETAADSAKSGQTVKRMLSKMSDRGCGRRKNWRNGTADGLYRLSAAKPEPETKML